MEFMQRQFKPPQTEMTVGRFFVFLGEYLLLDALDK